MSVNENEQWAVPSDDSPLDEGRVAQWESRGERIRRVSVRVLILRNCIGYRETSDGFHGASHVSVFYAGCNFSEPGQICSDASRARLLEAEDVLTRGASNLPPNSERSRSSVLP
jgi:hypothetical protein